MKKIILLTAAALFLLAARLPAQAPDGKVLFVFTDFSDGPLMVVGLARAAQLKQAGLDVRMLFEGSAVLCFLDDRGELPRLPLYQMRKVVLNRALDLKIPYVVSSESARSYLVYDALKTAGAPLSRERDDMADISDYIKQGYRIIVY